LLVIQKYLWLDRCIPFHQPVVRSRDDQHKAVAEQKWSH